MLQYASIPYCNERPSVPHFERSKLANYFYTVKLNTNKLLYVYVILGVQLTVFYRFIFSTI